MTPTLLRPQIFEDIDALCAGFTTRAGGASTGAFASLNMGLSTGDAPDAVRENRRRAARILGFSESDMAIPGQIHGAEVLHVAEPGLHAGYDGVVTDTPGILLAISAADCAAVLVADPDARVVGACHAGWRGAVGGIVQATVDAMKRLGADPHRLLTWVSPCISVEQFEVGEEVAQRFAGLTSGGGAGSAPDPADRVVRRPGWQRPHVDLAGFIGDRLREAGVPGAGIQVSDRCTVGESETFFSHRASGGHTGRMMGLIGLPGAPGRISNVGADGAYDTA